MTLPDDCPAGLDEAGRRLWADATNALTFPAVGQVAIGIRRALLVEAERNRLLSALHAMWEWQRGVSDLLPDDLRDEVCRLLVAAGIDPVAEPAPGRSPP